MLGPGPSFTTGSSGTNRAAVPDEVGTTPVGQRRENRCATGGGPGPRQAIRTEALTTHTAIALRDGRRLRTPGGAPDRSVASSRGRTGTGIRRLSGRRTAPWAATRVGRGRSRWLCPPAGRPPARSEISRATHRAGTGEVPASHRTAPDGRGERPPSPGRGDGTGPRPVLGPARPRRPSPEGNCRARFCRHLRDPRQERPGGHLGQWSTGPVGGSETAGPRRSVHAGFATVPRPPRRTRSRTGRRTVCGRPLRPT